MKYVHNIVISGFIKEHEDDKAIKEILMHLLPEDANNQGITLEEEKVSIDETQKMSIVRVRISKEKQCKETITILKQLLGEKQCAVIKKQENRVDENGFLYLRLDKQVLLESGEAKLVDHGNCIHIKILLAAYPKTKERALQVAKDLFCM